ncbi:MAG TPA: AraC family transcriptional regulator [Thermoanaerobaculia bacterium]|nr:AraC family transcriptional regulator [Thermoanaerobaculia bacterium]
MASQRVSARANHRMHRIADRRRYDAIFHKYVRDCCASHTVARTSELAQFLGKSRPSFSRIIRDLFGKPPSQILRELCLDEARRLLRVTDLGLDEIAAASALGDRSTLYRAFIAAFGVSAAEYRETLKGKP